MVYNNRMEQIKKRIKNTLSVEEINAIIKDKSKWTVISFAGKDVNRRGAILVFCKCECGTEKVTDLSGIKNLATTSCGCSRVGKFTRRKYSVVNKDIYMAYKGMVHRCYSVNSKIYQVYGAKGVIVCDEWLNDYESFLHWSLNNGWAKGLQLDKDILGDGKLYSPQTCKWVTRIENMNNRSVSVKYDYDGRKMTVAEVCRELGLNRKYICKKIQSGKTLLQAIGHE